MSESENMCQSDVDNFPLQTKLLKDCLNMRTGKKGEQVHIANVRSNAKTKMHLNKAIEKKQVESWCFNQELYEK